MERNKIESYSQLNESWGGINQALAGGLRGLPGNDSLARLLERNGRKLNESNKPKLTEKIILESCIEYNNLTGKWPDIRTKDPVPHLTNETWISIDSALRHGIRGLPGNDSLVKLLDRNGKKQSQQNKPKLIETDILSWCVEYREYTGKWPAKSNTDLVPGQPSETWRRLDEALESGLRSLPGGSSLAKLLANHGKKYNKSDMPKLTEQKILSLCIEHHKLTGEWPVQKSKDPAHRYVPGKPDETWEAIDKILIKGNRGLPGNDSLAKLLDRNGKKACRSCLPQLTEQKILSWCIDYHNLTSKWPNGKTKDAVPNQPNESWSAINSALVNGCRGLSGRNSLSKLLKKYGKKQTTRITK
jgi:hypothetical protein